MLFILLSGAISLTVVTYVKKDKIYRWEEKIQNSTKGRPITLESIWGISLFARIAPRTTSFTLQRQLHVNLLLHVDYYNIYLMRMPEIKTFLQLHNNSNHVFLNTRKDFNRKYIRILSFFTPFYFKNQENGVLCCI